MFQRFVKPQILIPLMLALFAVAGGLFFLIGTQLNKTASDELEKLASKPSAPARFTTITYSFSKLAGQPLNPARIESFAKDIPGTHGLGIFEGILYAASWDEQKIFQIDLVNGERKVLADELDGVHDMALDAGGKHLVVPVFREGRVVTIDRQSGQVKQLAAGLDGPNGIARARDGGFFVSNAGAGTIVKLAADGREERVVARDLREPAGIVADNDNVLLVAQYADPQNSVVQIADNGSVTPVIRGLTNAETILRDDERNVIVGHTLGGKAAFSLLPRGQGVQPLLTTTLPGPMVGPVTDGRFLYFESAAAGQSVVYRIPLG